MLVLQSRICCQQISRWEIQLLSNVALHIYTAVSQTKTCSNVFVWPLRTFSCISAACGCGAAELSSQFCAETLFFWADFSYFCVYVTRLFKFVQMSNIGVKLKSPSCCRCSTSDFVNIKVTRRNVCTCRAGSFLYSACWLIPGALHRNRSSAVAFHHRTQIPASDPWFDRPLLLLFGLNEPLDVSSSPFQCLHLGSIPFLGLHVQSGASVASQRPPEHLQCLKLINCSIN